MTKRSHGSATETLPAFDLHEAGIPSTAPASPTPPVTMRRVGVEPSALAEMTTRIVIKFLETGGATISTIEDLNALVETTFSTLLDCEAKLDERLDGSADALPRVPTRTSRLTGQPIVGSSIRDEHQATGVDDDDDREDGRLQLPDYRRIRDERRSRNLPRIVADDAGQEGGQAGFDTEKWLASFSNPSEVMIAEARADNPNNKRGWIGVYDDRIVCLFTGRPLKIIGPHLRRLFKNDENFRSFSTHAGYVQGLQLPNDYPKAAPYLSTIRIDVASRRGKGEVGRPAAIQAKIDKVLAQTDFDLRLRDKPDTRPANFPDFVVCLNCGDAVHDIRPHLRDKHKTNYDRYKRDWHISGRAPATGEHGMSFTAARRYAAELLEKQGIAASAQVKPDKWPGVLKDQILCMIDGKLVTDLEQHLASTGQVPIAHYRARFELPANYPTMPPSPSLGEEGAKEPGRSRARGQKPANRAKTRASTGARPAMLADDQPVSESTVEQVAASLDTSGQLAALTDSLKRDAEDFKQRKAAAVIASSTADRSAVTGMVGRKSIETRMVKGKGGAQPVTVERRTSRRRTNRSLAERE